MMDRVKDLHAKALTLRDLLEQYAPYDADIKEAYEWIKPLLDAVDAGKVICPTKFRFGWIFLEGKITCQLTLHYVALLLNLRMHLKQTISVDVTFPFLRCIVRECWRAGQQQDASIQSGQGRSSIRFPTA